MISQVEVVAHSTWALGSGLDSQRHTPSEPLAILWRTVCLTMHHVWLVSALYAYNASLAFRFDSSCSLFRFSLIHLMFSIYCVRFCYLQTKQYYSFPVSYLLLAVASAYCICNGQTWVYYSSHLNLWTNFTGTAFESCCQHAYWYSVLNDRFLVTFALVESELSVLYDICTRDWRCFRDKHTTANLTCHFKTKEKYHYH